MFNAKSLNLLYFLHLATFLKEGSIPSIASASARADFGCDPGARLREPLPGVQGAEPLEDFGFKLFRALTLLYLKVILVTF